MSQPPTWTVETILAELKNAGSEENRAGMKRYGIKVDHAFGVPMAFTRPLSKKIGKDPALARALWATGIHEARILAGLISDPKNLPPEQMDAWVSDFNSWDLCDQVCDPFAATDYAVDKIRQYAEDEREFVRRAAFAMIAARSVHAKKAPDNEFLAYLPLIENKASDPRNFVFKAVSWALRNIGKRSQALNGPAVTVAERLAASSDKTKRRIGKDAVRELTSDAVKTRLAKKAEKKGAA